MKNQKTLLIIVLIVVLAILGLVSYLAYRRFNTPKEQIQTQQNNQNETVDWKTYRNNTYGFEIGYPGNFNDVQFIDYKNPDDLAKYHIVPGSVTDLFFAGDIFTPKTTDNGVCGQYHIHITPITDTDINVLFGKLRKDLETPSNYEGTSFSSKISNVEDITIQGKVGKKYYAEPGFPHYNGGFIIINNGKIYQVSYLNMSNEKEGCPDLGYRGIFDKMVLSFKFTSSTNISKQDAVNLVRDLPEVQAWLRNYKATDTPVTPVIEVDHETETVYVVHVYEINGDHTATHNWYDVNKKTGEIKAEF